MACTVNSMDSAIANQSNVMLAFVPEDFALFENRSQSPETVAGVSSNDNAAAPTVRSARWGPIPLVGSNILRVTSNFFIRRFLEDVARIKEVGCYGVNSVCSLRGKIEVLAAERTIYQSHDLADI